MTKTDTYNIAQAIDWLLPQMLTARLSWPAGQYLRTDGAGQIWLYKPPYGKAGLWHPSMDDLRSTEWVAYAGQAYPDDAAVVEKADGAHEIPAFLRKGEEADKTELVNHPSHYGGDTVYETVKVLRAWLPWEQYLGFLRGNAIKYLSRAGKKGAARLDAEKATWYSKRLEEELRNGPADRT